MHRRRFLASVALAAGLAGCNSDTDRDTPTRSGTVPSTSTSTSTVTRQRSHTHAQSPAGPQPTASTETLQTPEQLPAYETAFRHTYRYRENTDAFEFHPPDEGQYVLVHVPGEVEGTPPSEIILSVDGRRFSPESSLPEGPIMPYPSDFYTSDDSTGWVPFDIPLIAATESDLIVDGKRFPLHADTVRKFDQFPEFVVESVSAPETARVGREVEFSATVRNDGDRTGVFMAGFQNVGIPGIVNQEIRPGETATVSRGYMARDFDMRVIFHHSNGSQVLKVETIGTPTPTSDEQPS